MVEVIRRVAFVLELGEEKRVDDELEGKIIKMGIMSVDVFFA